MEAIYFGRDADGNATELTAVELLKKAIEGGWTINDQVAIAIEELIELVEEK